MSPRPLEVSASAPAKINLHLGVGPVREDGFHALMTVYQALDLRDTVTATAAPEWSVEVRAAFIASRTAVRTSGRRARCQFTPRPY